MQVERISVSKWPASPDFFIKGSSHPISASEADRLYHETLRSQAARTIDESLAQSGTYQYWALVLTVFPIITVFGNVLVVLSVFRETNLHTATNYFIVSLAGADIGLAIFVMPLSGWVEANNGNWRYGTIFCDVFIMFDVMLCTASILNLAAISMDRYVAVTNPIVYSRHDNNFRVGLTIALAWILSFVIALPIACGLNNEPHRQNNLCVLYNPEYIITSSIGSFYVPCGIMIILYYRVFHAIRGRTKYFAPSNHTNIGNNSRNKETVISLTANPGAEQSLVTRPTKPLGKTCSRHAIREINNSPDSSLNQSVMDYTILTGNYTEYERTALRNTELLKTELDSPILATASCIYENTNPIQNHPISQTNGTKTTCEDMDKTQLDTTDKTEFTDMEHFRRHLRDRIKRAKRCSLSVLPVQYSTVSGQQVYTLNKTSRKSMITCRSRETDRNKLTGSRSSLLNRCFSSRQTGRCEPDGHIANNEWRWSHKGALFRSSNTNSTQGLSKDRMTAKRERKATKTLAIVLGVFLICWMPFFTINVIHAFCFKYKTLGNTSVCRLPKVLDSIAVWLGYINSSVNPIIYTIFNVEFRKAFKKLLHIS